MSRASDFVPYIPPSAWLVRLRGFRLAWQRRRVQTQLHRLKRQLDRFDLGELDRAAAEAWGDAEGLISDLIGCDPVGDLVERRRYLAELVKNLRRDLDRLAPVELAEVFRFLAWALDYQRRHSFAPAVPPLTGPNRV